MPESEKSVFADVRWNNDIQAWEIKEWNICQFEWTTWHDLKVTHWMPMPEPAEDCKTEKDCIPTPRLIDATTTQDIISGRYPVYTLGVGVSEDDLTDDEQKLWEQSKRWRAEN